MLLHVPTAWQTPQVMLADIHTDGFPEFAMRMHTGATCSASAQVVGAMLNVS